MEIPAQLMEDLVQLSRKLGAPERDLAILGEGNTSARVNEEVFLVKASGQQLGNIGPEGFCAVRFAPILACFSGSTLSDSALKQVLLESRVEPKGDTMPSVETFFHAYFLTLPGVEFVGHTHPTAINSILCSRLARELLAGRLFPDEIVVCGIVPCFIEYVDPGLVLAQRIKQRVEEYFEQFGEWPKTVWMQNHGFIALGRTAREVENITLMAVKAARILLGTCAGGGPNFLPEEAVNRIHTRPDEHYRQRQLGQRA